ncbi:hybrid sensor histidine kinase/response regulator transcription factor [Proteiniphilum acetatigenes]|uniref:hybrid sensor histidine kinase/response regulator transcription factor n=1 Tax=Proteiniphilum acetatigenes TaxID=294710 RepID=UPI000380AE82|nr:two-component regulator propeller domain-containing protein [Proteiniphilum acetatigenes]
MSKKKQNLHHIILLFIILMMDSGKLFCLPGYSFKHYNINNGLSQNTVFTIFQDNQGFMWFGTKDGLNRFDGTSFKIFKFSPGGNLRDNVFHRILQDKNDNLWVGTDDGIYIYNPRSEEFNRFEKTPADHVSMDGVVSDILLDNDGDMWISVEEKGVFCYNFRADTLTYYPIPQTPGGMRMISLCLGRDGHIWAFPYNLPFIRIDKKTGEVSEHRLRDDEDLVYNTGEIWKVVADEYNQLLIASSTKGIISVNTVNMTHRVLLDEDAYGEPIFARCLARIDPQTIWIGSESGLYIYNTETGEVNNLRHNRYIPYSLSDNAIYSIYKDREGGIWIGSFFGGVDYYSNQYNQFELFYPVAQDNGMKGSRVREFCSAPDGKIWIGTEDNGLNLFDPVRNEFLPLPSALQSLYTNIHALYADGDYLWIGTFSKGLNRYNLRTGELVTYIQSDDPNSISHNSTFAIHKDRQNTLWIGNLSGLNIYNYNEDNFTRIEEFQGIYIQDIFEDTDGKIWVSTFTKGLYRYDPATREWDVFLYDPSGARNTLYNKLTSVFEDSRKRLWVTTEGGGFYRFDKQTEEFITFNSAKGLPNDVVYQIVEDDNANLWLSTNSGLVCYNPLSGTFRNYTVDNGLKTNQFNYKSSYKASDGTIYFGSTDGFVRFNPSAFSETKLDVPIVFTELFVKNERVSPADERSLLKGSILYTNELILPYSKNSFRLEYAVLNYSNLNANNILYKLEGFDKEWIRVKDKQDIIYSNLMPGKYRLIVKLNGDEENENAGNIKTLAIQIRPPFWLSGWAYLIYFLLLTFSIILLFRVLNMREQRVQRRKMRIFESEKERELYRSKIDFFTNVAHEIRTPLSLIKAPLDHVIMTEQVSDNVKENLQIMSKNTDRLLNLTNQLLDFRKTESDAYSLNLRRQNASELIRETFLRFTPLARQRNLTFELDLPDNDIFVLLDKEAFLKIVSNLVNNAIKYCDSCVRMKAYISTDEQNNMFHLLTENDGEKIPDEYREEIFKPFVHLDKEKDGKTAGTGIGLALSKSLAELHKGNLVLENEDEWILFHLTLPVGETDKAVSETERELGKREPGINVEKTVAAYTILLVDDDVELLRFEEKFLSSHYHIKTAENGMQALEILREENVSLIVSDIMMPEMDGLELTKRVKLDIEFSHIPVILLTAKVNVESKVQGFETGADAYIDKPFSLEVLMAQIANLLQNREKLRETFLKNPFIGANSIVRTKSDEEFVKKLHAIVQENLDNSEFIVEDISEQFNMSRASFYRKIKGVLDLTPNEYIRVERLKKAAQLLKEKVYKVNEICYMVGFNSPSYFTKCFQQQFGVLPKDFE